MGPGFGKRRRGHGDHHFGLGPGQMGIKGRGPDPIPGFGDCGIRLAYNVYPWQPVADVRLHVNQLS